MAKRNLVTCVIKKARSDYYTDFIKEHCSDSRKLFKSAKTLFDQEVALNFEGCYDNTKLANDIGKFFVQKIERIRSELDTAATTDSGSSLDAPCAGSVQLASLRIPSQEYVKNQARKPAASTLCPHL